MHIKIDKEIKLENSDLCEGCDFREGYGCYLGRGYIPTIKINKRGVFRDPKCIEENGK